MKIRFEKLEIEIGDDFVEAVVDGFATLKTVDANEALRIRSFDANTTRTHQAERMAALAGITPSLVQLWRDMVNPPKAAPRSDEGKQEPSDQPPQG